MCIQFCEVVRDHLAGYYTRQVEKTAGYEIITGYM